MYKATFKVGHRLCEAVYDPETEQLTLDWTPDMPHPDSFSPSELDEYTAGRNALLESAGARVVTVASLDDLARLMDD